ncbi:DRAP1 [Acanthosepion pharaonis]|uniref:Dr1-associated corepressor n=1 Tax=Acanthosepion pharaonis TaxID=158019 RepID=A0A812BQ08_ACAPH|nr:DRAP1 [Sepia pharaonis]
MPNKKKKYNARFPPARIKKIMQTDEDVGKVAAAVPVIISRALELFIESLIMKASQTTQTRHAKTLTTAHIKQTIEAEKKFDFLRDLVVNIADHQTEEESEGNGPASNLTETGRKFGRIVGSRGPRKRKDSVTSPASDNIRRSKQEEDNNNEETDEAESEEEQDQDQNQTEEATTSSCLRGDEESPVPSSNGFPPTSVPPGCHSLGQLSSQFKVPALFSTTPLSRLFLPPGQIQGQQEDDDYDT